MAMPHHHSLSAVDFITQKPHRRTRSENILRNLAATSYPQALFSNLGLLFANGFSCVSEADVHKTANELRQSEREIGLFTFTRCLDFTRNGCEFQMEARCLGELENSYTIRDSSANHKTFLSLDFDLALTTEGLTNAREIATAMVDAFYRVHMYARRHAPDVDQSRWMLRKRIPIDVDPTGKGRKTRAEDTEISHDAALGVLEHSLLRPEFRLLLTHNTILVLDQGVRLWCVTPRQ